MNAWASQAALKMHGQRMIQKDVPLSQPTGSSPFRPLLQECPFREVQHHLRASFASSCGQELSPTPGSPSTAVHAGIAPTAAFSARSYCPAVVAGARLQERNPVNSPACTNKLNIVFLCGRDAKGYRVCESVVRQCGSVEGGGLPWTCLSFACISPQYRNTLVALHKNHRDQLPSIPQHLSYYARADANDPFLSGELQAPGNTHARPN